MDKSEWIWMPHPGHLMWASDCKFFLNTCVGDYIVSTVGEYLPDETAREFIAESRGVTLRGIGDNRLIDYMKKIGYEDVGLDRKYETMVFKAKNREEGPTCCPKKIIVEEEVDMRGYNTPEEAYKGHLELCEKYSKYPLLRLV